MFSINSEFFDNILNSVGFFDSKYPKTIPGLIGFLASKWIYIVPLFDDDTKGWQWFGFEINNDNEKIGFSEDFTDYKSYDEVIEAAIMESYCYLLTILEEN